MILFTLEESNPNWKEKMVGEKIQRNDHAEKFTKDSVAKALRLVMIKDGGKSYRSKAEEMSKIFGDKELPQNMLMVWNFISLPVSIRI